MELQLDSPGSLTPLSPPSLPSPAPVRAPCVTPALLPDEILGEIGVGQEMCVSHTHTHTHALELRPLVRDGIVVHSSTDRPVLDPTAVVEHGMQAPHADPVDMSYPRPPLSPVPPTPSPHIPGLYVGRGSMALSLVLRVRVEGGGHAEVALGLGRAEAALALQSRAVPRDTPLSTRPDPTLGETEGRLLQFEGGSKSVGGSGIAGHPGAPDPHSSAVPLGTPTSPRSETIPDSTRLLGCPLHVRVGTDDILGEGLAVTHFPTPGGMGTPRDRNTGCTTWMCNPQRCTAWACHLFRSSVAWALRTR